MRARKVHRSRLSDLGSWDWADRSRRPYVEGETAWIPVKDGYPSGTPIPDRQPYRGRGYQRLGDTVLLHGPRPGGNELDRILAWARPRAVIWVKGTAGPERIPETEVLYGSPGEVVHREHGCTFVLDPRLVMYAQGNLQERGRMAGAVAGSGRRERVADMFAGIGYFTIPMAVKGARVHALEINPVAFGYLTRNVEGNRVEDRVTAAEGNCRDLLSGTYDRVVMGHFDAIEYLPDALAHARAGTVIHLHSLGSVEDRIMAFASDTGFQALVTTRRVKKYAPNTWHMV
ncbi:MAG: SAM-dependent methyltransferase, partial [Methanomicrobiales archaeon]|nr:SAM-dependent methyltransferase [Methanomicrobiales archaeon]